MVSVLGISSYFHDSAASLLIDGEIVAAAQEERFTRKKHDSSFPLNAINYVMIEGNLTLKDIDYIVFYEKPFLKFDRLIETYIGYAPIGLMSFMKSMPIWLKEKLFLKQLILNEFKQIDEVDSNKIYFSDHHLSHAASAFYPSPFEESVILTADGVGEWATTTVAIGKNNKISVKKEINFPHSLGLLYSSFTYYLGFKVNSGEYKLMGLAPYGEPCYTDIITKHLMDIKCDGSFRLDQKYFNYSTGLTMTNEKFHTLFGREPRKQKEAIEQFHMDIAASIQAVIEIVILKICRSLYDEYKIKNLCLAGGVALNCVANGKIKKEKIFENLWIQPAAGDAGGSLGAAQALWFNEMKNNRVINKNDSMKGSYLGPSYSQQFVEEELSKLGGIFHTFSEDSIYEKTANAISEQKAVGWFQGRMEFGPRALGARSILADPRSESMQQLLNSKIKFRESFRPFAPSVLEESVSKWFEIDSQSPYMLLVAEVSKSKQHKIKNEDKKIIGIDKLKIKRSDIPAVTHVDCSARIQTVNKINNTKYYNLIKKFSDITGCELLINTSFNVRGEPIVNTPEDAFKCFMGTDIEVLVIENCILYKEEQDPKLKINYKEEFELD